MYTFPMSRDYPQLAEYSLYGRVLLHTSGVCARKLWHYFEAHTIKVLTNQPLNDIFGNRDSSDRISKWVMELSEYVIDFEKRNVIKSHILANFVVEWTEPNSRIEGIVPESLWLIYCDRAWGNAKADAVAILMSPSEINLSYAARL
jgi:hypothetical protein